MTKSDLVEVLMHSVIDWGAYYEIKVDYSDNKNNPTKYTIYNKSKPNLRVTCNSIYSAYKICLTAFLTKTNRTDYPNFLPNEKIKKKAKLLV